MKGKGDAWVYDLFICFVNIERFICIQKFSNQIEIDELNKTNHLQVISVQKLDEPTLVQWLEGEEER